MPSLEEGSVCVKEFLFLTMQTEEETGRQDGRATVGAGLTGLLTVTREAVLGFVREMCSGLHHLGPLLLDPELLPPVSRRMRS